MSFEYWLVDSFTNETFNGNLTPVMIFRDQSEYPTTEVMKKIAREFNASETSFLLPVKDTDNEFQICWFTPAFKEIALCGHATLASAYVLFQNYYAPDKMPERVVFHTRESGELTAAAIPATTSRPSLIEMDLPEKPAPEAIEFSSMSVLLAALKCSPEQIIYVGECTSYFGIVEVTADVNIQDLAVDSMEFCNSIGKPLAILTCRANSSLSFRGFDYNSRVFAAPMGIEEDVATGAAHCVMSPYWGPKFQKSSMKAFQGWGANARGSERSSVLYIERVPNDRVHISGENKIIGKGVLYLE